MIFKVSKGTVILLVAFILLAYLNVFLYGDKITERLIVNPICLSPFVITILLLGHVKSKLVGHVIRIWLFYFLCGLIFVTQSCIDSDFWTLDVSNGSLIYGLFLLAFLCGCLFWQKDVFQNKKIRIPFESVPLQFRFVFGVFPIFWLASFLLSVGYLPILVGIAFYDDVYNTNYGPLYGYVVFLSISFLIYVDRIIKSNSRIVQSFWIVACLLVLFMSIADGKRYTILTSLFALLAFLQSYATFKIRKVHYAFFLVIGLVLYSGVNLLRTGDMFSGEVSKTVFTLPVGVEFRDFVYTENNYDPGEIKGYDYLESSIASVVNGKLLELVGLDKSKMTLHGSAYTWKSIYNDLFGTEFGIRTGIFSELYFAYSFFGLLVVLLFSFILVKICYVIESKKYDLFYVFCACVMYALFVMLIVGQTTAFLGQSILLVYAIIVYYLFRKLMLAKRGDILLDSSAQYGY